MISNRPPGTAQLLCDRRNAQIVFLIFPDWTAKRFGLPCTHTSVGTQLDRERTSLKLKESELPVLYDTTSGYTLAYQGGDIQFPVYVVALAGIGLAIAAIRLDNVLLFGLALAALGFAYHNYPLLETGRPRLGAGQYGIFAEGLGILSWRAIRKLEMVPVEVRGSRSNELRITLQKPLAQALLADWRHRQFHRFLMRLPWAMAGKDVIRIPLDVFDSPAAEIYGNFVRMMSFYRN